MTPPGRPQPPFAAVCRRRGGTGRKPAAKKGGGKKAGRKGSSARRGEGSRPAWQWWLLRVVVGYLAFNLGLNLILAMTRPVDFAKLFELGHLDSRSEAALMLARHKAWHSSWEDEQNIRALLIEAAREERVDPLLLTALVEAESAGRPHVISSVGACGLTQLMPRTARELGVRDPFDPRQSLSGGARYLKRLLGRFRGDLSLALAAYNAGPGAVLKAGGVPPFRETRAYVAKIRGRYQVLRRGAGGERSREPASPPERAPAEAVGTKKTAKGTASSVDAPDGTKKTAKGTASSVDAPDGTKKTAKGTAGSVDAPDGTKKTAKGTAGSVDAPDGTKKTAKGTAGSVDPPAGTQPAEAVP